MGRQWAFAIALLIPVPALGQAGARGPAAALALSAGVVTPSPLFQYGPQGARLGLQLEVPLGHRWRALVGPDLWHFAIGCDAIVGNSCDPSGISVSGALGWYPPVARSPLAPFLAAGLGVLRGPNKRFALLPGFRTGIDLGGHRRVALRIEARFEPHVRRQVVNSLGDRAWKTEEAFAFLGGLRVRLR